LIINSMTTFLFTGAAHFVNLTLSQLVISSTCHFVNLTLS
jgi:hypothetical protein